MSQNKTGFFSSIPPVTKNLLIINVIIWLIQYVGVSKFNFDLSQYLGLHYWDSQNFEIFQLVTYMFLHSPLDPTHVFFNMFAVFMFGRTLETVWGAKRFTIYYLVTGIGAGIVQELAWMFEYRDIIFNPLIQTINLDNGSTIVPVARELFLSRMVTIGASGAVFGILLAFGMMFPNAELMIIPIPIPIKAKYFVIGYGLIELFAGVKNSTGDNVAHFAHLGGMLFGIILILYWKKKYKKNGRFY